MHSHSFQDTELKLHRYVIDSQGQVVEGLTILWYPHRAQELRVNRSENVNSACIRTVFKIQSCATIGNGFVQ